jgi:hypothetical protein
MIIRDQVGVVIDRPVHGKVGVEEPILRLERCRDVVVTANITGVGMCGVGLYLVDCENVRVRASFKHMMRGIVAERVTGMHVTRSLFQSIRSEGINIFEGRQMALLGNTFLDFRPIIGEVKNDLDHPDAIWISSQAGRHPFGPSHDVLIAHNLIDARAQGVFVSARTPARHSRIRVERNTILSGLPNAVYLQQCDESAAIENTVLGKGQWIRTLGCQPELRGNRAPEWMPGDKWTKVAPAGNERLPAI